MLRFSGIVKNKRGFLLYDVLLALAILSIGLVTVLRSFSTSLQAVRTSRDYFKATLLLEDKLWEMERENSLPPGISRSSFPSSKFSWKVETSAIEEEEDMSLSAVKVTISWKEGKGEKDIELTTWMVKERGD